MEWVLDNWFWILLGGGMVAMHLFGHGGHGGHGKNGKNGSADSQSEPKARVNSPPTAVGKEKQGDL